MPIRNPFAKRADPPLQGENVPTHDGTRPGFEKIDTVSSVASLPLSVSSKQSQEPPEYKMSGVLCKAVYQKAGEPWLTHNCA